MTKKYKENGTINKRFTPKQVKDIKEAWVCMLKDTDEWYKQIQGMQDWMAKETGINDIEFFFNDGEIVGVGTASRSHGLLQFDWKGKVVK